MRPLGNPPTFLAGVTTGPDRPPWSHFPPGLWSVTVSGRKHSVRLCSPRQAEAERWGVALREVISSKAPLETPTQLLLRDIQVRERIPLRTWRMVNLKLSWHGELPSPSG